MVLRSRRRRSSCARARKESLSKNSLSLFRARSRVQPFAFRPWLEPLEDRRLMAADSRGSPDDVDVILEWNAVLLDANALDHARTVPEQGGPILTARAFAMVSAAMYDAYNSTEKTGESYLTTAPRSANADSDAAVAQAAHDTLSALYPSQADRFDSSLAQTLDRIPNGPREDRGISVGSFIADAILAARADDGTLEIMEPSYEPSGLPGFHDVDPLHPDQGFYGSGAGNMSPFVLTNVDGFSARPLDDGTPAGRLAFLQSAEYTAAYSELLALGGDGVNSPTQRTEEQTTIGIFWGYDGRPGLGTPPRLYNQIVRTIATQEHNTEAENARLFALVNLAMADAGIASWNNKWDLAFWRPILAIRNGEADANPETVGDSEWTPLGAPASNPEIGETDFTPPFPAYTSGHATFGAAAFQILNRFYGRDDISFRVVSDEFKGVTVGSDGEVRPRIERSFDSFTAAKLENAQSRIYLGIHWAFDRDEGIAQGDAVADAVFDNTLQARDRNQHRHNPFDPEDVNDDGECSPLDALLVINELNAGRPEASTHYVDVNGDSARTPMDALLVINRLNAPRPNSPPPDFGRRNPTTPIAPVTPEFRTLDGTGNNRTHPEWGSTDEQLLRLAPAEYADGISQPLTTDRPSAREISNALAAHVAEALTATAVGDDPYEENDTFSTAANLGTIANRTTINSLVVDDSSDWYRFTIGATGTSSSSVSISFVHALGDLDLRLYNARGQRLRSSEGITNSEQVSLNGLAAGTYYVRVYGYRGVHNPNYSLTVNPPATVTPPPTTPPPPTSTGAFDIELQFSGLSASQQAVFETAAQKWESIITGDLPNATYNGRVVDDLLIHASAISIDGNGNVLGQAGPDRFRSGSRLPIHGSMQFDTADLAAMEANGTLLGVILHEMGHVLGIGTLWSTMGLLVGADTNNPRYVGSQGLAAYNAVFGTNASGVPLENSGGSGTRDAHWRESVFGNELMTGFVGPGNGLPLSRITVASLADLGYSVNIAAADVYAPPGTSTVSVVAATGGSSAASIFSGWIGSVTAGVFERPQSNAAAIFSRRAAEASTEWSAAVDGWIASLAEERKFLHWE